MKKKQFWVKLGFSLMFLALLVNISDPKLIAKMATEIDITYVFVSFLLSLSMIAISCWKWRVLLSASVRSVPFLEMMKLYFVGYYFSNLLPSNVGGDVARSYLLGVEIESQGHAAVSVFLERFTGMLYLLVLVILTPLVKPALYANPAVLMPVLGSAGLLVFFLFFLKVREPTRLIHRVLTFIIRRMILVDRLRLKMLSLKERFCDRLDSFYYKLRQAVADLRRDRIRILFVALSTTVFYGMTFINVYLAFRVFGIVPLWENIFAVTPVATLVGMLPLALFGGLGLLEASLTGYFALVGMEPASSILMALFIRIKIIVIGVAGFILFLQYKQETGVDIEPTNVFDRE